MSIVSGVGKNTFPRQFLDGHKDRSPDKGARFDFVLVGRRRVRNRNFDISILATETGCGGIRRFGFRVSGVEAHGSQLKQVTSLLTNVSRSSAQCKSENWT